MSEIDIDHDLCYGYGYPPNECHYCDDPYVCNIPHLLYELWNIEHEDE